MTILDTKSLPSSQVSIESGNFYLDGVSSLNASPVYFYTATFPAKITGFCLEVAQTRTAGTLTVELYKNNTLVGGASLTLDNTYPQKRKIDLDVAVTTDDSLVVKATTSTFLPANNIGKFYILIK